MTTSRDSSNLENDILKLNRILYLLFFIVTPSILLGVFSKIGVQYTPFVKYVAEIVGIFFILAWLKADSKLQNREVGKYALLKLPQHLYATRSFKRASIYILLGMALILIQNMYTSAAAAFFFVY